MNFIEQEVEIQGEYRLAGTLSIPQGEQAPYPVVVLLHASGDVDRDGNTETMPMNAFKELSELLAEEGFAVLRYDKRGVGKSEGEYLAAGFFDLVEDTKAMIEFVKEHPQLDPHQLILLGHNEGCLIAPVINQTHPVQGMILLSPSTEPLAKTIAWQRGKMIEDIRNTKGMQGIMLRILKVEKKFRKVNQQLVHQINNSKGSVIDFKGKDINAKWYREHTEFNVREYLSEVNCPVLAVTGTKDVQVKIDQTKEICELVKGKCEAHLVQDMTYVLRKTDLEPRIQAILNDYKNQVKKPVDPELKQLIKDWLKKWKTE
ncbi:alpha/beta hydrolase [Ammoniphilus resinae]|uniref:Pimeloyl-ACP methyl ester carboxylesterase n=1 Tax=Ammoniphilus resinae TaxID=861532 RepID=A0ABS4GM95_9BACL|nr:alpha/beta fold hydrolase [Ammoniphilus resinae]MBP1931374.1 pimeloyl-ACP methyl ester carboxylesterase [Ammoniphilus resinae]